MKKHFKLASVAAAAMLTASTAMADGTLVYCSEGSPEGFDAALYTSGTTFDASSKAIYSRLSLTPAPPMSSPAWLKAGKCPRTVWNTRSNCVPV